MADKKAQASLELLFIATLVIVISIAILGYFNSIKGQTVALGLAKTNTLDALNKAQTNFSIEKIDLSVESNGNIDLNIITIPDTMACSDINGSGTRELIIAKAGYSAGSVTIRANNIEC
ncbi:MAG: hypothetical protein PHD95_01325 [Candidatus ainarchaeum sp.]|nr:hypothetical protein [Candidatus ainarchaeum sp.]